MGSRNNSPEPLGRDDNIRSSSSRPMNNDPPNLSKFPMVSLAIGDWERISRHEGDLVAIVYYGLKKLIWEVSEGTVSRRIEISWRDIGALQATMHNNESVLEIQLHKPPLFFREIETPPGHHPNWQKTDDFTYRTQASIVRIHRTYFSPGVLEKNYEQLLQHDTRLLRISRNPFPLAWPYFRSVPLDKYTTSQIQTAIMQHAQGVSSRPINIDSAPNPTDRMQMEGNKDSDGEVDEDFHLSFLNDSGEI